MHDNKAVRAFYSYFFPIPTIKMLSHFHEGGFHAVRNDSNKPHFGVQAGWVTTIRRCADGANADWTDPAFERDHRERRWRAGFRTNRFAALVHRCRARSIVGGVGSAWRGCGRWTRRTRSRSAWR